MQQWNQYDIDLYQYKIDFYCHIKSKSLPVHQRLKSMSVKGQWEYTLMMADVKRKTLYFNYFE